MAKDSGPLVFIKDQLGIEGINVAIAFAFIVLVFSFYFFPETVVAGLRVAIVLSPLWVPLVLLRIFWHLWLNYTRSKYKNSIPMSLIEIKIPREIVKTPLAMEAVFDGMHIGAGESTWFARYLQGKTRPEFSLEIVSLEGRVHFYIYTPEFFVPRIKDAFYGQYPEVEIQEAPDYTRFTAFDPDALTLWGSDIILDPSKPDAMPIKTYIDYGLDKAVPADEAKSQVDPLSNLLEALGAIGPGEQIWLQILIRTNKTDWKAQAKEAVKKIKDESMGIVEVEGVKRPGFPSPTKSQTNQIEAIERSLSKQSFETGIRMIYIAKSNVYKPINIFRIVYGFKQFNSNELNSFQPTRWDAKFDYPWQEWFGAVRRSQKKMFDAYRRRSWFHYPYKERPFVLTTEELATIYHIPSGTVQVPTLERIPSRRSEAPPNLPT